MKKIKQEEEEEDNSKLFLTLMEGYSDSTIPLLSDLKTETAIKAPSKKRPPKPNYSSIEKSNKRRRNQEMERKRPTSSKSPLMEIHKEKQRRDKITSAYSILQSMVPNISIKAPRTRMVEETISYIQELEEVLKRLEAQKRKAASMAPPPPPPTVAVSYNDFITLKKSIINVVVSGKIAFFGINSEIGNRRFLFSKVVSVFEKHRTEILTATVSVNGDKKMSLSATVVVNGNGEKIEGIKKDLIRLMGSRN